jgi:hypothetical protein
VVERDLANSEELKKELKFWRQAQHTAISSSKYLGQGHLTPEVIVDYAEGKIESNQTKISMENHFQQYADCRQELDMIKQTYPAPQPARASRSNLIDLVSRFTKPIKIGYAVPIAAITIVLAIVILSDLSGPPVHYATLLLEYHQQIRGGTPTELPTVMYEAGLASVHTTIFVPHSGIQATRYALSLLSPSGVLTQLADTLNPSAYTNELDTLGATLSGKFFVNEGSYQVIVPEILPPTVEGLTPEEYRYSFVISASR